MPEPTRLQLELLALGELSGSEARALRERIAADPDLAGHFARIEREIAAARPLPGLLLDNLGASDPEPVIEPRPWPRWASLGAAAAAVAAVAAVALLWPRPTPPPVTFRGALDIEVVRIRDGVATRQGERVPAREGDRLQYTVTAPEAGYVSVFDVQDDGALTAWQAGEPIAAGGSVSGAAILDAYPGVERVVFVWAPRPVTPERFEAAVRADRGTPIDGTEPFAGLDGITQRSILVVDDP